MLNLWLGVMIFLMVILFLCIKYNSFYGMFFLFSLLGIEILLLTSVLSAVKFATVQPYHGVAYEIYNILSRFKLNYFDLKRIANLGAWIFAEAMLLVAWKNSFRSGWKWRHWCYGGLFVLVGVWILLLDSVRIQDRLLIKVYLGEEWAGRCSGAIRIGEIALLFLCCALPLWKIAAISYHTRIRFHRRFMTVIFALGLILSVLFWGVVYGTSVRKYLWEWEPDGVHDLYRLYEKSSVYLLFMWGTLGLILLGVIGCFLRFDAMKESWIRGRERPNHSQIALSDLRYVFHSYKNALFSIECMCDMAMKRYGTVEGESAIHSAAECARNYREQINKFLDIYNRMNLTWQRFNLESAIQEARRRVGEMEKIVFSLRMDTEKSFIYGDYNAVTEIFVNLFLNARDAIQKNPGGGWRTFGDCLGRKCVSLCRCTG